MSTVPHDDDRVQPHPDHAAQQDSHGPDPRMLAIDRDREGPADCYDPDHAARQAHADALLRAALADSAESQLRPYTYRRRQRTAPGADDAGPRTDPYGVGSELTPVQRRQAMADAALAQAKATGRDGTAATVPAEVARAAETRIDYLIDHGPDDELAQALSDPQVLRTIDDVRTWERRTGRGPEAAAVKAKIRELAEAAAPPLLTLGDARVKPTTWLVPGVLPADELVLIASPGGTGKSTLVRHVVARVTSGRCALGLDYEPPAPGKVLLLASEDAVEKTVLPGLLAEGGDPARVCRPPKVKGSAPDRRDRRGRGRDDDDDAVERELGLGPDDVRILASLVARDPEIRLIVVDPLSSYMAGAGVDMHTDDVRTVLDPLIRMAHDHDVCVLVVAHTKKDTKVGLAQDRVAGHHAIVAATRLTYVYGTDPDDPDQRALVPVKRNLIGVREDATIVRQVEVDDDTAVRVMTAPAFQDLTVDERREVRTHLRVIECQERRYVDPAELADTKRATESKVEACMDVIRQELLGGAVPTAELDARLRAQRYAVATIRRAKQALQSEGLTTYRQLEVWYTQITLRARNRLTPLDPMSGLN